MGGREYEGEMKMAEYFAVGCVLSLIALFILFVLYAFTHWDIWTALFATCGATTFYSYVFYRATYGMGN